MSEPRSFDIRISEKEEQLKKALEKVKQYKAQIKTLQTKKRNEDQRQRTHNLIVCGAEVAALYEHVLSKDEIILLVNFLKEQKEQGVFTIENPHSDSENNSSVPENDRTATTATSNTTDENKESENVWGDNAFDLF